MGGYANNERIDNRFKEVSQMALKLPNREEGIAKDRPIIIKQEIREDGIIVCSPDCIFYDDEYSYGCLVFQVKWDENIFHFKPHTCPGPGEYQLCPK